MPAIVETPIEPVNALEEKLEDTQEGENEPPTGTTIKPIIGIIYPPPEVRSILLWCDIITYLL